MSSVRVYRVYLPNNLKLTNEKKICSLLNRLIHFRHDPDPLFTTGFGNIFLPLLPMDDDWLALEFRWFIEIRLQRLVGLQNEIRLRRALSILDLEMSVISLFDTREGPCRRALVRLLRTRKAKGRRREQR